MTRSRRNEAVRSRRRGAWIERAFVEKFGGVYEHFPEIADARLRRRPDACDRHARGPRGRDGRGRGLARQAGKAPAHPQPPRPRRPARRSPTSPRPRAPSRAGAGLDRCTPEEFRRFQELNDAYKRKVRVSLHPRGRRQEPPRNPRRLRVAHRQRPRDRVPHRARRDRQDRADQAGRAGRIVGTAPVRAAAQALPSASARAPRRRASAPSRCRSKAPAAYRCPGRGWRCSAARTGFPSCPSRAPPAACHIRPRAAADRLRCGAPAPSGVPSPPASAAHGR